ncbi:hypothetical protein ACWKYP_001611 [Enterobacter hormaechei]|uniref:hypothetical protein n=1 Tax=Enterobacter hormaechei TaxID=158836 RepID=UPI00223FD09B|nr:hypothetical protein [Enterobacter hormaechei]ELH6290403.1 hypothetical protein [Escherichia coli]
MVSKLKQRRQRRLKADVAWWMAEAQDWKDIALEHAAEIDRLKKMVIRVPMPVVVPAEIIQNINLKGAFAMGIERYSEAMLKLAKKEDGDV